MFLKDEPYKEQWKKLLRRENSCQLFILIQPKGSHSLINFYIGWLTKFKLYLIICSDLSTCYQFSSVTQSCPTLCDPMNCSTPGLLSITNSRSSLKLMSIELVMPSSHLILCHPLLLLPPLPPSIRVFSSE